MINEALARRLQDRFGVKEPVGAVVDLPALGFGRDRRSAMTIVGVIGNERVQSDLRAHRRIAYVPIAQAPRMQVKLAVRTRGEAMAAVPAIRAAVHGLDERLAQPTSARWNRSGAEPVGADRAGLAHRSSHGFGPARSIGLYGVCRIGDAAAARNWHPDGAGAESATM